MAAYAHGEGVVELPLMDFAPDLAFDASNNGSLTLVDMDQCQPTVKGYQALNLAQPYGTTSGLPARPLGATLAYFSDYSFGIFAGTTNHLYRFNSLTNLWVQADALGSSTFGCQPTQPWRFAQFANDVIAVNGSSASAVPQVATGSGGSFATLAGSPPATANCVLSINGQVMMTSGQSWYVSALGTDNNWAPNVQTQAGTGNLYDFPGAITALAPIFRNVVAFKTGSMWLGNYIGGQSVWSWQPISDETGTWCQEAVINLPDGVAFLGLDDFYVCRGYVPQRIPNSLKEWVFDIADQTKLPWYMASRYDPYHAVCYWYFVSKSPPFATIPDRYVAWNTRTGRWAAGYLNTPCLPSPNWCPGPSTGGLPGVFTGLYFDTNNVLQTWSGAPGNMMLMTGYIGSPNNYTQMLRVKPVYYVKPTTFTVQPYHVANLGDADITGPTTVLGRDGWYFFRQYDRWHRFQINATGPGTIQPNVQMGAEISALLVDLRQGGWR